MEINWSPYKAKCETTHLTEEVGKITEVIGLMMKGFLPGANVGSLCEIENSSGEKIKAEVVGFRDKSVLLMPLQDMRGVGLGSRVTLAKSVSTVKVGPGLLGRVLNGLGEPIDDLGEIETNFESPLYSEVQNPLSRTPIREPMDLGVRAINSALTVGLGQRVSIMAGSGVGKSMLLGMMARSSKSDINVIALIGERGRELREFIENDLGPEGLKRSVVIVATSDQGPLLRMRAAYVATAIAEYFCMDQNQHVLLMMDSLTRFAMAQREIGLSRGEPPASRGYTPSVFSTLPKLLERAGAFDGHGSITGLYTVLVEADDMDDPIGDTVRSIVDGHIVLNRKLAQRGHYPSIDVLQSASRVFKSVTTKEHQKLAQKLREVLATYSEAEDLINIGAYKAGSNPKIDKAIRVYDQLIQFLRQATEDPSDMNETLRQLQGVLMHF